MLPSGLRATLEIIGFGSPLIKPHCRASTSLKTKFWTGLLFIVLLFHLGRQPPEQSSAHKSYRTSPPGWQRNVRPDKKDWRGKDGAQPAKRPRLASTGADTDANWQSGWPTPDPAPLPTKTPFLRPLPMPFLASPDALEVIVVTDWLTDLFSVSTDLTDVTLVSDDTYWSWQKLSTDGIYQLIKVIYW